MVTVQNNINNTIGASNSGVTNTLTIQNPSNTASSQAQELITVGGGTAGDVWTQYSIGSTASWAIGLDNSDSDRLKFTYAASASINPSSGTTFFLIDPVTNPTAQLLVPAFAQAYSASGATVDFNMQNPSNTAGSDVRINIQNGGTSGGDPYIVFTTTGSGINYVIGKDVSDSESLKITTNTPSDSTIYAKMTSAGEWTYPLQPAFSAYLASDDVNVTGAGAGYVLGTNVALTEIFDQNSDFNTNGTFTAPVTGRYCFIVFLRFADLTAAMTFSQQTLATSNRNYVFQGSNIGAERTVATSADRFQINATIFADMDAADTATVGVTIGGGAGNTADLVSAGGIVVTGFQGFLQC